MVNGISSETVEKEEPVEAADGESVISDTSLAMSVI